MNYTLTEIKEYRIIADNGDAMFLRITFFEGEGHIYLAYNDREWTYTVRVAAFEDLYTFLDSQEGAIRMSLHRPITDQEHLLYAVDTLMEIINE